MRKTDNMSRSQMTNVVTRDNYLPKKTLWKCMLMLKTERRKVDINVLVKRKGDE